jgi:hypothetical protein
MYEFTGRSDRVAAQSIQLTLVSDEYRDASVPESLRSQAMPMLVIPAGETEFRYTVDVLQLTAVQPIAPARVYRDLNNNGPFRPASISDGHLQMRIQRAATASLSLCDFLRLVNARELRGTVAGLDFHAGDEVLAGLRQFVAEMRAPQGAC